MPNSNPNPKPDLSNRDAGDYLTCRRCSTQREFDLWGSPHKEMSSSDVIDDVISDGIDDVISDVI